VQKHDEDEVFDLLPDSGLTDEVHNDFIDVGEGKVSISISIRNFR
jgi:hypothetical protein